MQWYDISDTRLRNTHDNISQQFGHGLHAGMHQLPRRLVWGSAKVLLRSSKKAWKIPSRVPRGYEIQIAIVTAATEPSWGLTLLLMPLAMKWGRRGSLQSDSSVSSRIIGEPLRLQKGRQRRRQRRRRSCMKHIINQLCLDSLSSCSCFRNLEHIFEY